MKRLEVVYGPMFNGKTAELMRQIQRTLQSNNGIPAVYAPKVSDGDGNKIKTRLVTGMREFSAIRIDKEHPDGILFDLHARERIRRRPYGLIIVDEAHFFAPEELFHVVQEVRRSYDIVIGTLDMDSKRVQFEVFNMLKGLEGVILTNPGMARCHICDEPAIYTQKLNPDGTIESASSSRLQPKYEYAVNDKKPRYEARCKSCYVQPI